MLVSHFDCDGGIIRSRGWTGVIPLIRGPEKVPPVMGITTRSPSGPLPTDKESPRLQLREYKNVRPGAWGATVWAVAFAGRRATRVVRKLRRCILALEMCKLGIYIRRAEGVG